MCIAIVLLSLSGHAIGQEGHPIWWWDCQKVDFIVQGELTYDSSRYYEVTPKGIEDRPGTYYVLVGTISINKVLYINKHSQHLEEYQQYLKSKDQKFPVLIKALKRESFHQSATTPPVFEPFLYDLDKGSSVFLLSQVFLFPFFGLNLEDGVPVENIDEAMKMINARPNNLLNQ